MPIPFKHLSLVFLSVVLFANGELHSFDFKLQQESTRDYYFPPADKPWQSASVSSLGWNTKELENTLNFVKKAKSGAFLILLKGKIVVEEYYKARKTFGLFKKQWDAQTIDPVFSAQKSVKAFITGLAVQKGLLKPEDKVSQYLSEGWTKEPSSKNEKSVTIENLLSMNSGLNKKLEFQWDLNTHWHYSSAYDKIVNVLEWVYSKPWDEIYREELFERIGCIAVQRKRKFLHMNAREMARFGLMVLAGGRWGDDFLVSEEGYSYFNQMMKSSNEDNKAYGYLWWLNGKESFRTPNHHEEEPIPGKLIPQAPDDLVAAMGFGEKRIYLVPSLDLVVVRHGVPARIRNSNFVMLDFDRELWKHLMKVF